jgi:ribosome-associated heat shock protein Hsp15
MSESRIRIDKWLWAARMFKTRALAARACELGRIHANGNVVKASREVHPGDILCIVNESGEITVEVLALSAIRGPAAIVQTLYRETEESIAKRRRMEEERKAQFVFMAPGEGRPSKRDRRELNRIRGR